MNEEGTYELLLSRQQDLGSIAVAWRFQIFSNC